MTFVKHVYDNFIEGTHHKQVAHQFEKLSRSPGSRIIVNMPPRHTKSEFASYLLPAWLIGKNPELKIIQTTHTAELAVRFGRKVRNLMEMDVYREIFPEVDLRADSKAAGRWRKKNSSGVANETPTLAAKARSESPKSRLAPRVHPLGGSLSDRFRRRENQ